MNFFKRTMREPNNTLGMGISPKDFTRLRRCIVQISRGLEDSKFLIGKMKSGIKNAIDADMNRSEI